MNSDRVLRLALLLCPAWVAVVLAMPGDAFEGGRVYDVMQAVASEELWAFGTAVVVFFGAYGVFSGNRVLCLAGAGVTAAWYVAVGVCHLLAFHASIGASGFITLAVIAVLLALRDGREWPWTDRPSAT